MVDFFAFSGCPETSDADTAVWLRKIGYSRESVESMSGNLDNSERTLEETPMHDSKRYINAAKDDIAQGKKTAAAVLVRVADIVDKWNTVCKAYENRVGFLDRKTADMKSRNSGLLRSNNLLARLEGTYQKRKEELDRATFFQPGVTA